MFTDTRNSGPSLIYDQCDVRGKICGLILYIVYCPRTRVSYVCTIFGPRKEARANNNNFVSSEGHINVIIHGYRARWGRITRYIVLFLIWKDPLESSGTVLVNTLYGPARPCYTFQCRSPTCSFHHDLGLTILVSIQLRPSEQRKVCDFK